MTATRRRRAGGRCSGPTARRVARGPGPGGPGAARDRDGAEKAERLVWGGLLQEAEVAAEPALFEVRV